REHLSCCLRQWHAEPGRHRGRPLVRDDVYVSTAIHGRLERKEERPERSRIGRALKDLSDRQRSALPGAFARKCGGDAGAERTQRGDPITLCGKAVGVREEIRGRLWTACGKARVLAAK